MKRTISAFLFVLGVLQLGTEVVLVAAEAGSDSIMSSSTQKCDEANTSKECQAQRLEKADKELNATYTQLLSVARGLLSESSPTQKEKGRRSEQALRKAQRAWMKYRDSNCESWSETQYPGTSAGLAWQGCMIEMTISREKELKEFLNEF